MELALGVAGVLLQGAVLVVVLLKQRDKKAEWQLLGKEYARMANAYANSLGGSEPEKLQHAIEAFKKADIALDGKRDFTDAQVRIFVSGERHGA
jgi:hypothetical protein